MVQNLHIHHDTANGTNSPDMSPGVYDLFAKVKEPLWAIRHKARDGLIRAIGRSMRIINKGGCADGVRRLPNIWQKVFTLKRGSTLLKIHKCYTLVNKSTSELSNCCHYFLSNPWITQLKVIKWFWSVISQYLSAIIHFVRDCDIPGISFLVWDLLILVPVFQIQMCYSFFWPPLNMDMYLLCRWR